MDRLDDLHHFSIARRHLYFGGQWPFDVERNLKREFRIATFPQRDRDPDYALPQGMLDIRSRALVPGSNERSARYSRARTIREYKIDG